MAAAEAGDKLTQSNDPRENKRSIAVVGDGQVTTTGFALRTELTIDVFDTSIGWFGLQFRGSTIQRIKFGFSKRDDVLSAFEQFGDCRNEAATHGHLWRETIKSYAAGDSASFLDFEIDSSWMTPFQKRVIHECRQIPSGSTVTYGQLAQSIGSPGAARAVGSVMRTNRFPIVVPCHRVLSANGLGGFSAGAGPKTKRVLLELEQAITPDHQSRMFD